MPMGHVYQINLKPETEGQRGLPKHPVENVFVNRDGLVGDFNRWRHEETHDDPTMAVLLMPLETIEELNKEGWPLGPGDLGENFTTEGIAYGNFAPPKSFKIGGAVITVTKACDPCNNLYAIPKIAKRRDIVKALYKRRGWYARVDQEGKVSTGDPIIEVNSGLREAGATPAS